MLRLARLFAAGKRRSHLLVANYQRCFAQVRVVLSVVSASLFSQNRFGAREVCTYSKMMFFIISHRFFAKEARCRGDKSIFGPWARLLVALGPPSGVPGAQEEVILNRVRVSQSGVLTRRKQPPEPEQNTLETWPLMGG